MNIMVMSPHCHGNGNTTVAALIAAALAKQNTKVCLTHVVGQSEALFPFYNIKNDGENATDAVQLTNLIRTGGMQKNSLANYCKNISTNYDVFSLDANTTIKDEELADVVTYVAQNAPYDYVVFDVDENNLDRANIKAAIDNADCIILVLTQKITEVTRFMRMKSTFLARTSKVPKIVVVNKYRNVLGDLKETAEKYGVKDIRHWHYIHDNPYIMYMENKGQLLQLSEFIRKRDGEVIELDTDIQKIIKDIISTKHNISKSRTKGAGQEELDE